MQWGRQKREQFLPRFCSNATRHPELLVSQGGATMIRRLLPSIAAAVAVAGSGAAADLPYGSSPYTPPAPIFTWTGFYLGGQIGYGWANNNLSGWGPVFAFSGINYVPNGVVGGAHVGYNLQFNQFVLGVEG